MSRVVAAALVVTLAGCSSSYRPAASPRIAVSMQTGTLALHKDGVTTSAGQLFGGVEEVVRGNPRAEAEARTAHGLMVGGLVLELAGLSSVVGAGVLEANQGRDGHLSGAATGMLIGGIAAEIAAFVLIVNAPPHVYDAVNIYNDGLPSPFAAPAFGGPPAGGRVPVLPSGVPSPTPPSPVPAPDAAAVESPSSR